MPAEDILRVGKHAQLLRLGDEVRVEDRIGDRLDGYEGRDEGRHVGVVGTQDELGRGDAVAEEAFDLVVEDGAGAVVPESERGFSTDGVLQGGGVEEIGVYFGERLGGKDVPRVVYFF